MAQQELKRGEIATQITNILKENVDVGGLSVAVSSATTGSPFLFSAGHADILRQEPMNNEHVFGIGSITKVFVAVVILQLIEEGKLSLTDTVGQHLSPAVYRGIDCAESASVEQLLSHRAGIDSWEDELSWIVHGRGREMAPAHVWNREETLDYIRRPKMHAPAPGNYDYSNTNYTLLGLIIDKVTRTTAESQIRLRILQPLKMHHTFLEGFEECENERAPHRYHFATSEFRDTAGVCPAFSQVGDELIDVTQSNLSVEWAAGGLMSTTTDLLKFGRALKNGLMFSPASTAIMQSFRPTEPGVEMGCGLFRLSLQDKGTWLGHSGGVLGFSAGLWWKDDCVLCLLWNVGTMHTGTKTAVMRIIRETEFLPLVTELIQT